MARGKGLSVRSDKIAISDCVAADYEAGMTISELAAAHSVSPMTMRRRLEELGVSFRRRGTRETPATDRFLLFVSPEPNTGCWLWTGCAGSANGYGYFSKRRADGASLAHRAAYELFVGQIPTDLHIDHLCRNTFCVNPAHLEPVTQLENNKRQRAARSSA